MIKFGLPKGGVKEKSIDIIKSLIPEVSIGRKLSFNVEDKYKLYLLKHRDIPHLVANNVLDIGITSSEWVIESGCCDLTVLKELNWCDTKIALFGPKDFKLGKKKRITVATEFPNIANKYFLNSNVDDIEVISINGSSEALVPDPFECGVDCVETKSTLIANQLVVIDEIYNSKVVVISRHDRKKEVQELLNLLSNKEVL